MRAQSLLVALVLLGSGCANAARDHDDIVVAAPTTPPPPWSSVSVYVQPSASDEEFAAIEQVVRSTAPNAEVEVPTEGRGPGYGIDVNLVDLLPDNPGLARCLGHSSGFRVLVVSYAPPGTGAEILMAVPDAVRDLPGVAGVRVAGVELPELDPDRGSPQPQFECFLWVVLGSGTPVAQAESVAEAARAIPGVFDVAINDPGLAVLFEEDLDLELEVDEPELFSCFGSLQLLVVLSGPNLTRAVVDAVDELPGVIGFLGGGIDTSRSLDELSANCVDITPEFSEEDLPSPGEEPFSLGPPIDASGAVANYDTTTPDFDGALPGDDGEGPLALGEVNELPGEDYLNFLFEFCQPECYRDAHFMDPNNPQVGSGPWTTGRPFHVRHGFISSSNEPLGEGFDVVMYVTRWEGRDSEAFAVGQTYKFTSDYVLRGTSDQCGPTYKTQTGPETCEWFVHDFLDGLPQGRYDLWAVWEAPCSAWVDLGFTDSCDDANEVISLFSAGVNSPFEEFPPSFTEENEA